MKIKQNHMTPSINRTTVRLILAVPCFAALHAGAQPVGNDGTDESSDAPAIVYSIQAMPALEENRPWRGTNSTGMNEAGHIVGIAENDIGFLSAVVWIDGQIVLNLSENSTDTLHMNIAKGINNHGDVVGQGWQEIPGGGTIGTPMGYSAENGIFNPAENDPQSGWAWAVNDSLQVGFKRLGGGTFIYDPIDGVREFGFPGRVGNEVWEINNAGQATGSAILSIGRFGAYRYDYDSDTIEDLHNASLYSFSEGYGINENGDIVGWALRRSDMRQVPMVWTVDGREIELETADLGINHGLSQAEHINGHGQVVGVDGSFAPEIPIGWIVFDVPIWTSAQSDGANDVPTGHADTTGVQVTNTGSVSIGNGFGDAQMILPKKYALRSFLSPDDQVAWTRLHPFEINEAGQICGTGVVNNSTRAFLMTPEPVLAGDLNLDGRVNYFDASVIIANLGKADGARPLEGDIDRDKDVDYNDLIEFARLIRVSTEK